MRNGRLDEETIYLFQRIMQQANLRGINRIIPTHLFQALLEEEKSPLYDAILVQFQNDETLLDLPELLYEFQQYIEDEIESIAGLEVEESEEHVESSEYEYEESCDFVFSEELEELLDMIVEATNKGIIVGIDEITAYLVFIMPANIAVVLSEFGISTRLLKKEFEEYNIFKEKEDKDGFNIPEELKSFVTNLNEKLKGKKCDICGRDKECELVWQTLQKRTKRNAILIGEPGVGKTSIAEKITYDILSGNCPEKFKDTIVLSLDVNSSVAGTMYRGQAEERYSLLTKFLEKAENVILFIDEIHLIRGAGSTKEGQADLANAIKPILAGNHVRMIGATTVEEYEKYFSKDGAIKRRFRPIEICEPKSNEVYPMLKNSIKTLSEYHGVSISRKMVDFIILNSSCYNYETKNPDRTKDLIDLSMVVAKQQGKKRVDRASVLANFKYNIKQFSMMSDKDKHTIAYHEAGHCVVLKCSEYLKSNKVIAVSIMPAENYRGVTVFEKTDDYVAEETMEYFIDEIASDLAGRVAERMFTGNVSAGAAADLKTATNTAYKLVTQYGMSERIGVNRIYFDEINSQKVMDNVNDEIDKIIEKAMKRAEQIIKDNNVAFKMLVEALVDKGIVSERELKQIFIKDKVY